MAEEEITPEGAEAPAPKKKGRLGGGRSNLIPALVVAAGLVGGGALVGKQVHSSASAQPAAPTVTRPGDPIDCKAWDARQQPKPGAVAKLDPVSINLEDDRSGGKHYAKVGIALQLADSVDAKKFNTDNQAYRALDVVNSVVANRSVEEFATPQARQAMKAKITDQVRPLYDCVVLEVLFTDFVMQ
ncbi:MAG: flagellar basal body-associated protein FliL [Acidimicrobiia bacterium]|nr:flagellar basal body-associated protein FliL [Acidimicrobiia bacterium]